MKKKLLFGVVILCLISGCGKNENTENEQQKGDIRSEVQQTGNAKNEEQIAEDSFPKINYDGTYYKMKIEPVSYNEKELSELLVPGMDQSKVIEDETPEGMQKSIENNNIKHVWYATNICFTYFNDTSCVTSITEDEALVIGNNLVKKLDMDVMDCPSIKLEEGVYTIEYTIQHEGVEILGNRSIDLGIQETETNDGFAYGEHISVSVNDSGIKRLYLSHIFDIAEVTEEYNGQEDFVNQEKVYNIISIWFNENYKSYGVEVNGSFTVDEISIIYIPYLEKDVEVLKPAFRVKGVNTVLEEGIEYEMLIDAVTGYVVDVL